MLPSTTRHPIDRSDRQIYMYSYRDWPAGLFGTYVRCRSTDKGEGQAEGRRAIYKAEGTYKAEDDFQGKGPTSRRHIRLTKPKIDLQGRKSTQKMDSKGIKSTYRTEDRLTREEIELQGRVSTSETCEGEG